MRLTNKFNLPQTFVNVLSRNSYTKGKAHVSVTELINSPRIVQLTKRHWDDLEEDVADKVWAIFGTAIHSVLELGKDENHIIEQRLHANIDGWDVSGAIDLQKITSEGIEISDYKTTAAWGVMNEKSDWEQQLNIYAWLVEKVKKVPVTKISIVAIIRDWSRREAQTKENYPEAPIKTLNIKLWSFEERDNFVRSRVNFHSNAYMDAEMDNELPLCTPKEMWEKETSYAIKKTGNKRATTVLWIKEDAEKKLEELGKGYEIEVRPGERTRCENFCLVSSKCDQYQNYLKQQEEV